MYLIRRIRKTHLAFLLGTIFGFLFATFIHLHNDSSIVFSEYFNFTTPEKVFSRQIKPMDVIVDSINRSIMTHTGPLNLNLEFFPNTSATRVDVKKFVAKDLHRSRLSRVLRDESWKTTTKFEGYEYDQEQQHPETEAQHPQPRTKIIYKYPREIMDANYYKPKEGKGHLGEAVELEGDDRIQADKMFALHQFNLMVSDMVPINRTLPDFRSEACKLKKYPDPKYLPDASIIIVFYNEAFSTLVRTVSSVLRNSPPELVKEILLVDDASDRAFLREELKNFLASLGHAGIKIIRAQERVGLTVGRLIGAHNARGSVLVFLDSHCECTTGWLEPLLARISEQRNLAICPTIDSIHNDTLKYESANLERIGAFNRKFDFRWYMIPQYERERLGNDTTRPVRSPAMAGGLFAIDRRYFYEVGAYDKEMKIWGGENIEMSLRIWQCGGGIEISSCSRVGHIFRHEAPDRHPNSTHFLHMNFARLAQVWLDEHKWLLYRFNKEMHFFHDQVNVSERLHFKESAKCNSFQWFLDNVWPDHFLPVKNGFFGRIRNFDNETCLFIKAAVGARETPVYIDGCSDYFEGNQYWTISGALIKSDENMCLTMAKLIDSGKIIAIAKDCTEFQENEWIYDHETFWLKHKAGQLCLEKKISDHEKFMTLESVDCDAKKIEQKWYFQDVEWSSPF